MKHTEFYRQNQQGNQIFGQLWQPDASPPAAAICLVHGYGEHSGRYAHVAQAFTEANMAVITQDHQGHGRSEGRRGDIAAYDIFLDDIDYLVQQAAKRFPHVPRFIYGHSMGGNLVLNYVLRRNPALDGVIVASPWLRLANPPSAMMLKMAQLLVRVWPSFTTASGLDNGALSRDPAITEPVEPDPLSHNKISIRMFILVDSAGQWALDHARDFSLPLLLMHGTADRITNHHATIQFASQVPCDVTFKLWDGFYHETHNEPEKQDLFDFVINWIQSRIQAAKSTKFHSERDSADPIFEEPASSDAATFGI